MSCNPIRTLLEEFNSKELKEIIENKFNAVNYDRSSISSIDHNALLDDSTEIIVDKVLDILTPVITKIESDIDIEFILDHIRTHILGNLSIDPKIASELDEKIGDILRNKLLNFTKYSPNYNVLDLIEEETPTSFQDSNGTFTMKYFSGVNKVLIDTFEEVTNNIFMTSLHDMITSNNEESFNTVTFVNNLKIKFSSVLYNKLYKAASIIRYTKSGSNSRKNILIFDKGDLNMSLFNEYDVIKDSSTNEEYGTLYEHQYIKDSEGNSCMVFIPSNGNIKNLLLNNKTNIPELDQIFSIDTDIISRELDGSREPIEKIDRNNMTYDNKISIITNIALKELDTLIKQKFPFLASSKVNFNHDYSSSEGSDSNDQETGIVKLMKFTSRIPSKVEIVNGVHKVVMTNDFMDIPKYTLITQALSRIPRTGKNRGSSLLNSFSSGSDIASKSFAESVYYTFFHPDPYEITYLDPITNKEVTKTTGSYFYYSKILSKSCGFQDNFTASINALTSSALAEIVTIKDGKTIFSDKSSGDKFYSLYSSHKINLQNVSDKAKQNLVISIPIDDNKSEIYEGTDWNYLLSLYNDIVNNKKEINKFVEKRKISKETYAELDTLLSITRPENINSDQSKSILLNWKSQASAVNKNTVKWTVRYSANKSNLVVSILPQSVKDGRFLADELKGSVELLLNDKIISITDTLDNDSVRRISNINSKSGFNSPYLTVDYLTKYINFYNTNKKTVPPVSTFIAEVLLSMGLYHDIDKAKELGLEVDSDVVISAISPATMFMTLDKPMKGVIQRNFSSSVITQHKVGNDKRSVTMPVSAIDRTHEIVNSQLDKNGKALESSILKRNRILSGLTNVGESDTESLVFSRLGISKGDRSKSVADMSLEESKIQMINIFIEGLALRNPRLVIQPAVMSDRMATTIVPFIDEDILNSLEINDSSVSVNNDNLRETFVKSQANYYEDMVKVSLVQWKKAFENKNFIREFDKVQQKAIQSELTLMNSKENYSIYDLNTFLSNTKLPTKSVQKSEDLVKSLFYGINPDDTVSIRTQLLDLYKLFTGTSEEIIRKRDNYINLQRSIFLNKIGIDDFKSHFISSNHITNINKFLNKVNKGSDYISLSKSDAVDVVFDMYFWTQMICGNAFMNLHTAGVLNYGKQYIQNLVPDLELSSKNFLAKIQTNLKKGSKASDKVIKVTEAILQNINMTDDDKVSCIITAHIDSSLESSFVDQIKRNALLGSKITNMYIAEDDRAGFFMTKSVNEFLFDDPTEVFSHLLGTPGIKKSDALDAAVITTPLQWIAYNNSMGNEASFFYSEGSPIKSINNSSENLGHRKGSKKAEFLLTPEYIKFLRPETINLLEQTLKTVPFDEIVTVPTKGSLSDSIEITSLLDLKRFHELLPDNITIGNKTYNTRHLFNLNSSEQRLEVDSLLNSGETIKVEGYKYITGSNAHDLFLALGGFSNMKTSKEYYAGKVFHELAHILGNYKNELGEFSLRDKYVGSIGFGTHRKMGQQSMNRASELENPDKLVINKLSTVNYGTILQAAHEHDITKMYDVDSDEHGSEASVPIQVAASNIFEGRNNKESIAITECLSEIAEINIESMLAEQQANIPKLKLQYPELSDSDISYLASKQYIVDIAKQAFSTRENNSVLMDALNKPIHEVVFDLKYLSDPVRGAINGKINSETVRFKTNGGQFIVAPSHGFIESYTYKGNPTLTRSDINRILHSKGADTEGYTLNSVAHPSFISPFDDVIVSTKDGNKYMSYAEATQQGYKIEDMKSYLAPSLIEDFSSIKDNQPVIMLFTENGKSVVKRMKFNEVAKQASDLPKSVKYQLYLPVTGNVLKGQSYIDNTGVNIVNYSQHKSYSTAYNLGKITAEAFAIHLKNVLCKYDENGNIIDGPLELMLFGMNPINLPRDVQSIKSILLKRINSALALYKDTLFENIAKVVTDPASLKALKEYTKSEVHFLLEKDNWTSTAAEFYLPPLHQEVFFIKEGDSLTDILGVNVQPDIDKLVINGLITAREALNIEKAYNTSDSRSILKRASKINKVLVDEYINTKNKQRQSIGEFYAGRINDMRTRLYKLASKEGNSNKKSKENVLQFMPNKDKYRAHLISLLSSLEPNSPLHKMYSAILNLPNLSFTEIQKSKVIDIFIKSQIENFKDSLPKSLEFIGARIPAQGKQSYFKGKIKNFIFSTKNSAYGPLDMLVITGADYDIDKITIMSWGIDSNGNMYDWTKFEDRSGKLNRQLLIDMIEKEYAKIDSSSLESSIKEIKKKQVKKALNAYYKEAMKNRLTHNLLVTIANPKNAIEASTMVSTDEPQNEKDRLYSINTEALSITSNPAEGMSFIESMSPLQPMSIIEYERSIASGKMGIGLYASKMKVYSMAYYAYTNIKDEYDVNATKIKLFEDTIREEDQKTLSDFGRMPNSHFIIDNYETNGQVIQTKFNLNTLSNNPNTEEKLRTDVKLDEYKYKMSLLNDEEEQINLAKKFQEVLATKASHYNEYQTWIALSELLSAATDNAKLLILGNIGIKGELHNIVGAMLFMGLPLKNAINIVNKPEIQKIISTVEKSKELYGTASFTTLEAELDNIVIPFPSLLHDNNDEESIKKGIEDYYSNPIKILKDFAKVSDEIMPVFSVSSINTGLANQNYDIYSFFFKVDKSLKTLYDRVPGAEFVSIKDFVTATDSKRQQIIQDMSNLGIVSTINPFYIINKNTQFMTYLKALILAENMLTNVTYTSNAVKNLILNSTASNSKLTKQEFQSAELFIHSIAIEQFLNSSEAGKLTTISYIDEYEKEIKLNLKYPEDRAKFIKDFPLYIQQIAYSDENINNIFLQALTADTSIEDKITNQDIRILRIDDLNKITIKEEIDFRTNLDLIKDSNPELYKALYMYSLITTKGGNAKGSFYSLFQQSMLQTYEAFLSKNQNFLKKTLSELANLVPDAKIHILKKIAVSSILPVEGNIIKNTYMMNNYDTLSAERNVLKLTNKFKQKLASSNISTKSTEIIENKIFKHRASKLIYGWFDLKSSSGLGIEQYSGFVPIIPDHNTISIPFNTMEQYSPSLTVGLDLKGTGYQFGWAATFNGEDVRVLSSHPELSNSYIIWNPSKSVNSISIVSRQELSAVNPNLILHGNYISYKSKFSEESYVSDLLVVNILKQVPKSNTIKCFLNKSVANKTAKNVSEDTEITTVMLPFNKVLTPQSKFNPTKEFLENYLNEIKKSTLLSDENINNRVDSFFKDIIRYVDPVEFKTISDKLQFLRLDSNQVLDMLIGKNSNDKIDKAILDAYKEYFITNERGESEINTILDKLNTGQAVSIQEAFMGDDKLITSYMNEVELIRRNGDLIGYADLVSKNKLILINKVKNAVSRYIENSEDLSNILELNKLDLIHDEVQYTKEDFKDTVLFSNLKDIKFDKVVRVPKQYRSSVNKKHSKSMNILMNALKNRFPGIDFITTRDANLPVQFKGKSAFILDGKIHVNLDHANISSPIHELTHIYSAYIKVYNKELYSSLMNKILNMKEIEQFKVLYPELKEFDVAEELFAHLVGLEVQSQLELEDPELWNSISKELESNNKDKGKITEFFGKGISHMFGTLNDIDIDMTDSLSDIIVKVGHEIAFSRHSLLSGITTEGVKQIMRISARSSLSKEDSISMLKELGMITFHCS